MNIPIALEIPVPQMPLRRLLGAYWTDLCYEVLRMLRSPAFAIPLLCIPAPLYLLMTTMLTAAAIGDNPQVPDYLFLSFAVFAAMGPALLGAGATLAPERNAGLLRRRRALPAPEGSYIQAKVLVSIIFAGAAMGLLIIAARVTGGVHFTPLQQLAVSAALVAGALPFCAVGLFIGAFCSGCAAPSAAGSFRRPSPWACSWGSRCCSAGSPSTGSPGWAAREPCNMRPRYRVIHAARPAGWASTGRSRKAASAASSSTRPPGERGWSSWPRVRCSPRSGPRPPAAARR
jgi:hypothetical protein